MLLRATPPPSPRADAAAATPFAFAATYAELRLRTMLLIFNSLRHTHTLPVSLFASVLQYYCR